MYRTYRGIFPSWMNEKSVPSACDFIIEVIYFPIYAVTWQISPSFSWLVMRQALMNHSICKMITLWMYLAVLLRSIILSLFNHNTITVLSLKIFTDLVFNSCKYENIPSLFLYFHNKIQKNSKSSKYSRCAKTNRQICCRFKWFASFFALLNTQKLAFTCFKSCISKENRKHLKYWHASQKLFDKLTVVLGFACKYLIIIISIINSVEHP